MCRVLIIDDEEFSAKTIKMVLEEAGEAQADYATTYKDARELVQQSLEPNEPYDVFLIDLRLGSEKDGIEFMKELRAASPDTDAIIFTGLEDSAHGIRAYEAGAFRYLYKPFENEELLYLLKAVKQKQKEEQERDWQKLFTSMMEEALHKITFLEVANVVVKYALKLGFTRAHLFWVPTQEDANPDNRMVGITCAGNDCILNFSNPTNGPGLYPLKQWFNLNRIKGSHEVIFFGSDEFASIKKQAEKMNYRWPRGEITMLPLWGSNRHLGELMLDHGQKEKKLSKHEPSLLDFFARQVAIVLENASLISREQRSIQETTIINQIGRQVTDRAAKETNLPRLFDEVREQIGLLMDVSNFVVVLFDPESGNLNISLSYENGIRHYHSQTHDDMGIEKSLVTRESNIFWPWDVPGHLQKNKIVLTGKAPISCIGVQLHVGNKAIGGIVVKNYGEEEFSKRDYVLLSAVANQISGAIKLIQANETERRDAERLIVLQQVMMEMLRIGQENEDDLWTTILTIATANFGLGFNRALLFLENDEHTLLKGKNGIGTNDPKEAWQDWDRALEKNYHLDDFLAEIQQGRLHLTPFHNLAKEITLPFNGDNNAFMQVIKEGGHRVIVEEDHIKTKLPAQVRDKISPSACAILPILTGNRAVGLVMVDNKHNSSPLSEKMLNHLQTLLNYTGLVRETLRQQSKSESLLDANYQIMGEARSQSLKDTLHNICETARTIMEADWVLAYPLKEGEEFVFDKENAAYAGQLKYPILIKDKPDPKGISDHILDKGKLVINDVSNQDAEIREKHISTYEFIKNEGIKAVLAIAIRDIQRDETLGIFYLDYRTPRNFSPTDEHHAIALASLAAIAISNARRFDEQRQRQRLEAALQTAQIISTELDFDNMLIKVLDNLKRFFQNTSMCVLTYDSDENALRFVPATLKHYRAPRSKKPETRIFPLDGPSIAALTARLTLAKGESVTINVPDVSKSPDYLEMLHQSRSELCVSFLGGNHELIGVLALERASIYGFSEDDQALVETVASQLCLGMERARQSEQLSFKTTVAALTSWAADIAHDINNEAGEIKGYTYLVKELAQGNEKILSYMSKIEESAQRLFDAGPKSVQGKQVLPLNQAIKKYAEQLAHQRDIEVEFLLDEKEYQIFVNPTDVRRVLQHLTRNADKAMRGMPSKKISILTREAENSEVEILFRDHGPGVPEEVQLSVFQKSVTTKQSGGFGLLLTRQFVEDMGGTIRLLPAEPGEGATFSIKLPTTKFDEVNVE